MRSDTTPAGFRDLPAIWDKTRDRIIELVRGLPDTPPTPPSRPARHHGRDVMAHLISV